jgi:hypothetical protein
MDYSLLMGVHYTKYAVNLDVETEAADPGEVLLRGASSSIGQSNELGGGLHRRRGSNGLVGAASESTEGIRTSFSAEDNKALHQMQFCVPLEVSRVVGPDCYYVGIIDFQQKWTWAKKIERFMKVFFEGRDSDGLSAIDIDTYYHRFCDKMESLLDLSNEDYERTKSNLPQMEEDETSPKNANAAAGEEGIQAQNRHLSSKNRRPSTLTRPMSTTHQPITNPPLAMNTTLPLRESDFSTEMTHMRSIDDPPSIVEEGASNESADDSDKSETD